MVSSMNKMVVSLLLCCGSLYAISQTAHYNMHLSTTDDGRVVIAMTLDAIPDQKFIFTIPEVFAVNGFEGGKGGLMACRLQYWKISDNCISTNFGDINFKYYVKLDVLKRKEKYSLI